MTAGLLFQTYSARIGGIHRRVGEDPAELDHVDFPRARRARGRGATSADRFVWPIETAPAMPPAGHRH